MLSRSSDDVSPGADTLQRPPLSGMQRAARSTTGGVGDADEIESFGQRIGASELRMMCVSFVS
jgi:hypothetical protein